MYSGSLDLFRLNPWPNIVKAKIFFQTKHSQLPGNFNHTNQKPSAQSPGHPHFCNIPAAGLDPRDLKRLLSLTASTAFSWFIPWDLTMFFYGFSHPPPFLPHPNLAPMRSSCCTWSSCGNKRKSKGHGIFLLILAYFLPPRLCELRVCWSWRLAAAINPSNIFEFNVFAVSLPMFASHGFAIVHHGERRQDKNQQFKVFKKVNLIV